tara:strand:- start:787 stop:1014 length:228 start_codon:yes stop_codon:yes gene_type:complete
MAWDLHKIKSVMPFVWRQTAILRTMEAVGNVSKRNQEELGREKEQYEGQLEAYRHIIAKMQVEIDALKLQRDSRS